MGNMMIFFILLITVNSLVTSLFVWRITGDFKRFFPTWCGMIFVIQIIAIAGAIPLPMEEELPFVFAFVVPIAIGAFALNKMINKMNPKNGMMMKIRTWQSLGITTLAQVLSWLASFSFLPRYH